MILIRVHRMDSALLTGTGFWLAFFLSRVLGTDISETDAVKLTDEDRLLEELFKRRHYNPDSRPVESANDVVAVQLAVVPIQLSKIDDLNEVMHMLFWIQMVWTDFRLAWNESDYGGLVNICIPCSKLWRPDIVLMNRAEQWSKWAEVNVIVASNGVCEWAPPMMAVSYCPIDIEWFPFDEQECPLTFESWSHDITKLNLTARRKPIDDKHYRRNSEWDLLDISHNDSTVDDLGANFSILIFNLNWKRRTLFYGFNLILPCSLLAALSAATFILPPQTGERIGLGISTLLAMMVTQLIVADRVPPTSDAIPLITIYFVGVMTVNAFSLMAMVGISNLYHRSSTNMHPMPNWVKTFVCIRLGKLLRMPKPAKDKQTREDADNPSSTDHFNKGKSITVTARHDSTPSTDVTDEQSPEGDDIHDDGWKYAALVIDRLCFYVCILCITSITLVFYACAFAMGGP